jgi:predicted enzyme related to lactoylglutathione lyase
MLGGFFRKSSSNGKGALVIIYSENLERTINLIEANGGEITISILEFPWVEDFTLKILRVRN